MTKTTTETASLLIEVLSKQYLSLSAQEGYAKMMTSLATAASQILLSMAMQQPSPRSSLLEYLKLLAKSTEASALLNFEAQMNAWQKVKKSGKKLDGLISV